MASFTLRASSLDEVAEAMPQTTAILHADDECSDGEMYCSLNALQLHGSSDWGYLPPPTPAMGWGYKANAPATTAGWGYQSNAPALGGGWTQLGDKMWGSGAGMESISPANVGYYDQGMYAAAVRCSGPDCALMTNPAGHRSVNTFHIHFVHYARYGASLRHKLEQKVCGKQGWHGGGLPCGGKAAFFSNFPAVFSVAMGSGSIHHASVIAWPKTCGGSGTIVEIAYGCSIEHQIRGDYKPGSR